MKLKTLKDMALSKHYVNNVSIPVVCYNSLKQQGIEWGKHLKQCNEELGIKVMYDVEFIKHFFNITDEDLK